MIYRIKDVTIKNNFPFVGIMNEDNHRLLIKPSDDYSFIEDAEIKKELDSIFTTEIKQSYQKYLDALKPTTEEIEAQNLSLLKLKKENELNNIKVTTTAGNEFDGNETARNNMVSAVLASDITGITTNNWKLADNSIKEVSVDEIKEALTLSIKRAGEIILGDLN